MQNIVPYFIQFRSTFAARTQKIYVVVESAAVDSREPSRLTIARDLLVMMNSCTRKRHQSRRPPPHHLANPRIWFLGLGYGCFLFPHTGQSADLCVGQGDWKGIADVGRRRKGIGRYRWRFCRWKDVALSYVAFLWAFIYRRSLDRSVRWTATARSTEHSTSEYPLCGALYLHLHTSRSRCSRAVIVIVVPSLTRVCIKCTLSIPMRWYSN